MKLLDKYITIVRDLKHNLGTKESTDNTDKSQSEKAYRIFSKALNDYILLVEDDRAAAIARDTGTGDVVYTKAEIAELMKVRDHETLRQLHEIKRVFEKSKISTVAPYCRRAHEFCMQVQNAAGRSEHLV